MSAVHRSPPDDQLASRPVLGSGALIVTPTFNERDNLTRFAQAVLQVAPGAHLLIVDDNSPDGTGRVADDLARTDPRVRVLHRSRKLGLGTAYVEAFRQGLEGPYSSFIEMDADLSHDPKYLPSFFAALARGADVVTGSRNMPGGGIEGWGIHRYVLSKGGTLYARLVLGVGITDLTTGYKAFSRHAIETIGLDRVQSNGYSFQIEMTYRALVKGLTVEEVPIVFVDRQAGRSKMSGGVFREAILVVWKLRLAKWLRRL